MIFTSTEPTPLDYFLHGGPQEEAWHPMEKELWVRCDQCGRQCDAPGALSEGTAAAHALGQGWKLKRYGGQSPSVDNGWVGIEEIATMCELICERCFKLEFE